MSDKLVRWLNDRGYQAVFMPPTAVAPPELYHFVQGRLVRGGALKGYLPAGVRLPKNDSGQLPNIQLLQTSAKNFSGAARFLAGALRPFGITQAPGINLSFAGTGDLVFKLVGITYQETPPAKIVDLAQNLRRDLIPREYVETDGLHVVYHYAYAASLEMRRADNRRFESSVSGVEIENLVNANVKGFASVENGDALVFNANSGSPIAFAYKAGQLRLAGNRFEFFPEKIGHFTGQAPPYVPSPGSVQIVENW